jgi:hypothetical protein
MDQDPGTQPIELLWFNEWEINFFPIFAQERSQLLEGGSRNYKKCAQESGKHLDAGRYVRHG